MRWYRKRRRSPDGMDEGGQDSFLDITSNIVGILIILVMVAGVRATTSLVTLAPDEARALETQHQQLLESLDASTLRLAAEQENAQAFQESAQILDETLLDEERKYAAALDILSSAQADLETMSETPANSQAAFLQAQLDTANEKLSQIAQETQWHRANPPAAQTLENRPTPLARQAENKEAHFCLMGNKISHVPVDLLLGKLQIEITNKQNELMKQSLIESQVGPLDDYVMRYRLVIFDVMAGSMGLGRRLELDYAEFLPTAQGLGENMPTALTEQSIFLRKLAVYRQNDHSITLWVYPDSFDAFRQVREFLYQRGYQVAARPCGVGQPISASPRGNRSSVQ